MSNQKGKQPWSKPAATKYKKFYGTFGFGQVHDGKKVKDYYVLIRAKDEEQANELMKERFGNKYAQIYSSDEMKEDDTLGSDSNINFWCKAGKLCDLAPFDLEDFHKNAKRVGSVTKD